MGICCSKNTFQTQRVDQAQIGDNPPANSVDPDLYYIYSVCPSVCKIRYLKTKGTGFLIKLNANNHSFFCLMTNEHIIKKEVINRKEEIELLYDNEDKSSKIMLDKNERFIKTFKFLNIDCTIVEILQKDGIDKKYFLSPNENYENTYKSLKKKEIYIPQFAGGNNLGYSKGHIMDINEDKNEFSHNATTEFGSSGSPIFLIRTKEVIGIHTGTDEKHYANYGNFIFPIIEYLKNYSKQNKTNNDKGYKKDDNYSLINSKYSNYLMTDLYDENERIKRSVWKLYSIDPFYSTGFFCLIPSNKGNKFIPVFITSCYNIGRADLKNGNKIMIYNNEKIRKIEINRERRIYCGLEKDIDITIIEIKPADKINYYLELDESILTGKDIKKDYKNKSVYVCNYQQGKNIHFSFGEITDVVLFIDKSGGNYIFYTCETFVGSCGAPIISSNSNKVVGVHQGSFAYKDEDKQTEMGIVIQKAVNDFINSKNLYKI